MTVAVGTHDHGQGHQTTFRQIISTKLGIDPSRIRFSYGDTDEVMIGTGTFGSRSTACGGTAMLMAAEKIIAKGRRLAAHLMEAGEDDIEFRDGRFVVAGTDRQVDLAEVARTAFVPARLPKGMEPGLFETGTFDGGERTYPNGCHIAEVEIDAETGAIVLKRYTAVDDVGHMINPLLVEGQLHGGIVQGVGQALMEHIVYDGAGQLVTGSFMDYRMPRARRFLRLRAGRERGPDQAQSARRQGRRRIRHGRRAARGDERGQRRACRNRRALRADAGDRRKGVAGDPGGGAGRPSLERHLDPAADRDVVAAVAREGGRCGQRGADIAGDRSRRCRRRPCRRCGRLSGTGVSTGSSGVVTCVVVTIRPEPMNRARR